MANNKPKYMVRPEIVTGRYRPYPQKSLNNIHIGGMIKFRIFPKIWERERCKFGEVLEKRQMF